MAHISVCVCFLLRHRGKGCAHRYTLPPTHTEETEYDVCKCVRACACVFSPSAKLKASLFHSDSILGSDRSDEVSRTHVRGKEHRKTGSSIHFFSFSFFSYFFSVMFSWVKQEQGGRNKEGEMYQTVTEGLLSLYTKKLLPLEETYLFHDFHSPALEAADFQSKPMVLLVGQYSTGKTTFIRYECDPQPSPHTSPAGCVRNRPFLRLK